MHRALATSFTRGTLGELATGRRRARLDAVRFGIGWRSGRHHGRGQQDRGDAESRLHLVRRVLAELKGKPKI